MTIAFRVDGGGAIGVGHLMRCLTLARALRERGAAPFFLCRPRTLRMLRRYWPDVPFGTLPSGLPPALDALLCRAWLAWRKRRPEWLVVDHYGLGREWESRMRPHVRRLMAIDDLGRAHECDLLLDANLPSEDRDYTGKVPPSCRLLLGPGYALLRPGFNVATRHRAGGRPRIFLCFGGADPLDMTRRAAMALAGLDAEIDVVAGIAYGGKDWLERFCASRNGWRCFIDHPHPEQLMAEADLAVGAGGTMSWERCAMGLPSVVVSIAGNQRSVCRTLAGKGAIHYLGHYDEVSDARIREAAGALLADVAARAAMAAAARALVDPRGAERVAESMMQNV